MLEVSKIKKDFPLLKQEVNNHPLIYLDNAATTQKPQVVLDTVNDFYKNHNANVHRGIYQLSEKASILYEAAREKVRQLIRAKNQEEIIFTRGTTESINLVAYSWGRKNINSGDEILVTEMEHHSNIVPWQLLAKEKRAKLNYLTVDDNGYLELDKLDQFLNQRTKLLALTHVSNVLGTINPLKEIVTKAHTKGALVLVDGAQAVPHLPVNVLELDCDFYAFSGHKMLGPTGIGVLYAKKEILEEMPPFLSGGDMIKEVTKKESFWNDLPWKFEAGTMPIAQAIGLGAAVDYLNKIGLENIWQHEQELIAYTLERIKSIPQITIFGPKAAKEKCGVLAFNLKDIHPHDLASVFDENGLAIRAGHHCAQVLMKRLGVNATARASFYVYNDKTDIDKMIEAINKAIKIFQ